MTTRILFFFAACCLIGCMAIDSDCCEHTSTEKVGPNLYVEHYRTFCAGVFGERTDCYLTDSVGFRQQIGFYVDHDWLKAVRRGDSMYTYNLRTVAVYDTVERLSMSKDSLFVFHQSDSTCLANKPLFGTNTILCDSPYLPASSWKTDDGYYMAESQFHCGNEYLNAVYYTDSVHFSIFIGVYSPGSLYNNYQVQRINDRYYFYNLSDVRKTDTTKVQTFSLTALKKAGMTTVCK